MCRKDVWSLSTSECACLVKYHNIPLAEKKELFQKQHKKILGTEDYIKGKVQLAWWHQYNQ